MADDFDDETPEEAAALDRAAEVAAGVSQDVPEPIDVTAMANRRGRMKESVDSDAELSQALSAIADGLISVVVVGEYLVGNFGDWADTEAYETFDAIAAQFGLTPKHEDEVGDLLAMDEYADGREIELTVPPTLTQESLKGWIQYP